MDNIYIAKSGIVEIKDKNISISREDLVEAFCRLAQSIPKEEIMAILNKPGNSFMAEYFKTKERWNIWRHKNDEDFRESRYHKDPFLNCFDYSEMYGNLMLNEGAETIWNSITGLAAITVYSNPNARLGVGNSNSAAADTQTALQGGSSNFQAMDTLFPALSGTGNDSVEFQSIFGSADGNFAWEEFTVDNGATANKNINRLVSSQGTKSSGQTWTLKLTLQLT